MPRRRGQARCVGSLIAAALVLAACAAPPLYVPLGTSRSYGYAESQLSQRRFEVIYRAPRRTTYAFSATSRDRDSDRRVALAYDLALLRSADLALDRGLPAFAVLRRDNDVQVDVRRDYYHGHRPFYSHRFGYPLHRFDTDPYAVIAVRVTLLVELRDRIAPNTFDAAATATDLRTRYVTAPDAG